MDINVAQLLELIHTHLESYTRGGKRSSNDNILPTILLWQIILVLPLQLLYLLFIVLLLFSNLRFLPLSSIFLQIFYYTLFDINCKRILCLQKKVFEKEKVSGFRGLSHLIWCLPMFSFLPFANLIWNNILKISSPILLMC